MGEAYSTQSTCFSGDRITVVSLTLTRETSVVEGAGFGGLSYSAARLLRRLLLVQKSVKMYQT